MTVQLIGDRLVLGDGLAISFMRTLRIPDDGRSYPLPPGLGCFPVRRVDDYLDRVPEDWRDKGGVFLPMYQREAMWMAFHGSHWKPRALKIGVGKVCAITGERWSESLHAGAQDYVVAPPQPWLDGIAVSKGTIRQFVAMPLGMGYTVEGQITGEERFGGIQIKVFEPKPGRFFPPPPPPARSSGGWFGESVNGCAPPPPMCAPMACAPGAPAPAQRKAAGSMGLAAGGRMKQSIYPDPHGLETWNEQDTSRVFVHIVNTELWREITGEAPPATPVTAKEYAKHGLPWFDLYDDALGAISGSNKLASVKSVKEMDATKSTHPLQDDTGVDPAKVVKLAPGKPIRDGNW